VSRKHLKITKEGNRYFIEDLRSRNGTYINGSPISPGKKVKVEKGLPIVLGSILFSLGKAFSGDVKAILNAIDISRELDETRKAFEKRRPMTTLKNLELIYKVSNVLMQSLDINEIFEKILDYIFDLLKRIDRGVIILVDSETREISEVISRPKKSDDDTGRMYSQSIVNRVIGEGLPVIMSDTQEENENDLSDSMEMMKIGSVMCVPLISKSQIRGVIYVDSIKKAYGFRKGDLSLLTALSSPAAMAIENALLYSNSEKIVEDRTKSLRETEKKLRESDTRFRAIFDNMSSGVIVCESVDKGKDFVIINLNSAARRIEKLKKKKVVGKRVLDILPVAKDIGLLEIFKRVWETGKSKHHPVTLHKDEGINEWREYYVYRLPSGEIVTIYDDVTDKKKAETEQKALQEQLFVSQKMESIGAFAGGTAHNFRNILQAILGNIEYLEMINGEEPEIKELVKNIYDSVEKGVDLINNLLHFSKRGGEYELVDLDLADVILKINEIIDRVFDKKIQIKLDLGKKLFVKGNHALLSQVFMNLFTNARDAMPDGGTLLIETKKARDKVIAIVSDTGHGMDKETLERIFDPFFTLKDVGKGTGLGLSTTHGIIEQHGGSISASSEPDKGATFKIYLPLVKTETLQKAKTQKEIVYGKGEKVLIVDDERAALDALNNLTKSLGYKTIPVDKPVEALKNYGKWSPDVVLMDRSMPKLDGISCIREIMKTDPNAKVIIVSGYEDSGPNGIDTSVKGLIKGYITKPCGLEELSHELSRALER
jgi:PAS domain S-box-containing protein